jgi:3-oxoadipate enol-lactonase
MPLAEANGIELYYELAGPEDAPPLLAIGGSGQTLAQAPVLANPLAQHFRVLAYDQRCLGRSGWGDRQPEMADYAADAVGLLDHVGWDRVPVIGTSFGGMVAQELAVTYPERVERLVLACTSPGGPGGASYPLHLSYRLPEDERAGAMLGITDTRGEDAGPEYLAIMKMISEQRLASPADPRAEAGFLRQLDARSRHDVYDRLPRLDLPVLVAGGRYDGIAPVSNQEAMHRQIRGSRLRLFDGGHLFMIQDPTAWPTMVAFLLGQADPGDPEEVAP